MKTKKNGFRLLSLALCLVLVLSLIPAVPALAEGSIAAQGNGWKLDSEGKLTILGMVQNPTTGVDLTPWKDYKDKIKTVYAETSAMIDNFTALFANCKNLVSADLSRMYRTQAKSANFMFSGCTSLTEVKFSTSSVDTSSLTSMAYVLYHG